MYPRSYEGHMDWEPQEGARQLDPTSPFTHAARGGGLAQGFNSPSKQAQSGLRQSIFATPSKSHQSSHSQIFPSHLSVKPPASPFRNPSFLTPRKTGTPASEASGAEDSPALTEGSPLPNDTPEADRLGDIIIGNTISPSKINKHARYRTSGLARKNMSGKGDIKPHRESDASWRRKRQAQDIRRRGWADSDDASDTSLGRSPTRNRRKQSLEVSPGVVGSLFHMLDKHANTPDNLHRWIRLGVNGFLLTMFCYVIWAVFDTVRSDVSNANEAARQEILSKMAVCQNEYLANGCAETTAPRFKELCSEWFECMTQNPNAIMSVRVITKQVVDVLNEFFGNMNLKASAALLVGLTVVIIANNAALGRSTQEHPRNVSPAHASTSAQHSALSHDGGPGFMWVPVQTPRHKRYGLVNTETETDSPPPKLMLPPYTPSRRSPSKGERSLSPIKYGRGSSNGYERY